ncbi:antibiotic biosynthesis monooxygenase family protein [Alkalicoccobacillus porphyridii]|uniref:Antibiotic biosynthesis monooxygenase n=1 Tax=Alkalicoccobacillus porphyridii TaxID=2597270 RepID=A0A553ZYS9_9BACI|nr:antibiotic biosynthesis monooxygenase family protein [Alkalicoccobacillus porphyridii]TSB46603.1 antibiotic biosynthesis monooxygenase [Alkalicoccobacillus porphyridii]
MYVVMNELHVPSERKAMLTERFAKSADNMSNVPGCLEFLFLNNEKDDGKQVVFTKWETKQDYENWLESDAFQKAHQSKSKPSSESERPAAQSNQLEAYTVEHHSKSN